MEVVLRRAHAAELVVAHPPLPDQHPAAVYLARLAPGSRPTQQQALETIAEVLSPGTGVALLAWHRLRYQHTQAVRAELATRYAPATANRMLAALRGVLKEAWRLGLVGAEEHARATDLEPVRGVRLLRGRALEGDELVALFEACDVSTPAGLRDRALLALLFGCGLRRAEVVSLDLRDIKPANGSLRVRGKGNKERLAYLQPDGVRYVSAWLAARGGGPGALFLALDRGHRGARLTDDGVFAILRRLGARAGIERFSPHDLRRTFVSQLLDEGVDLATVQQMAGHAQVTTTARYDRRGESAKQRAAGRLRMPG